MPQVSFSSPVGDLTLNEEDGFLTSLQWNNSETQNPTELLTVAQAQVMAYFAGELEVFDLPLAAAGTGFQKRVWLEMQKIPYGQVKTYGALAGQVKSGSSSAARAVGTACGANPIPIIIPCHRVIAAQGLGGYSGAGGLATKQTLLAHEGRQLQLV